MEHVLGVADVLSCAVLAVDVHVRRTDALMAYPQILFEHRLSDGVTMELSSYGIECFFGNRLIANVVLLISEVGAEHAVVATTKIGGEEALTAVEAVGTVCTTIEILSPHCFIAEFTLPKAEAVNTVFTACVVGTVETSFVMP
jgi:hypothetical protein